MSGRLDVRLRRDFTEVEDGSGYLSASATLECVGAGLWSAAWPRGRDAFTALVGGLAAGDDLSRWGVVVREEGSPEVLWSGPVVSASLTDGRTEGFAGRGLTVTGITDTGVLGGWLTFPDPTVDVSTTPGTLAAERDTRSGFAETILLEYIAENAGPAAGVARRQTAALVVPVSAGRGSSIQLAPRFETLLSVARSCLVSGGVVTRLVQGGPGELVVEVSVPTARPELAWSVEAGTLEGVTWTRGAAEATDVLGGGQGEGTARSFVRRSRSAPSGGFGFARERFRDATSSADPDDLVQATEEALAETGVQDGLTIAPTESVQWRYGVDYSLGDLITVDVLGTPITDRLERLVVSHSDQAAPRFTPQVGEYDPDRTRAVVRRIAAGLAARARA